MALALIQTQLDQLQQTFDQINKALEELLSVLDVGRIEPPLSQPDELDILDSQIKAQAQRIYDAAEGTEIRFMKEVEGEPRRIIFMKLSPTYHMFVFQEPVRGEWPFPKIGYRETDTSRTALVPVEMEGLTEMVRMLYARGYSNELR